MAENTNFDLNPEEEPSTFDSDNIWEELSKKGYCVVPGVLNRTECDEYVAEYKEWLDQFGSGVWPTNVHSVINGYKIGHFRASWEARLKAKQVFACLWETDKLLTSVDAVAIAEPPEIEGHMFARPDQNWFHLDQGGRREGIHCVQGAIYLEETTTSDYCFRVIEGTHNYHKQFFEEFPNSLKNSKNDFLKLNRPEIDWYKTKGCHSVKVTCPKGGVVLWDSRLVHDNARPEHNRLHSDRWRFVVFVCMTPAIWASAEDIGRKCKYVYKKMYMTNHWPSQNVGLVSKPMPNISGVGPVQTIEKLPDSATTHEAKQLMGIDGYDFYDGQPNGPDWDPVWSYGTTYQSQRSEAPSV